MKLQVWWIRNFPYKLELHPVYTIGEAKRLLDKLATEDLKNEAVVSNAGGLRVLDKDGEWIDSYCRLCMEDIDICECPLREEDYADQNKNGKS